VTKHVEVIAATKLPHAKFRGPARMLQEKPARALWTVALASNALNLQHMHLGR